VLARASVVIGVDLSSIAPLSRRRRLAIIAGNTLVAAAVPVHATQARRDLTFPRLEAPSQLPILSSHKEGPVLRLKVSGMTCEGCANAVKRAIGRVSPAAEIAVDLASGEVRVDGPVSTEAAASAIAAAGFAGET
jgi:copper chaperone